MQPAVAGILGPQAHGEILGTQAHGQATVVASPVVHGQATVVASHVVHVVHEIHGHDCDVARSENKNACVSSELINTDRQTDRQADRQTGRQADRQTDGQARR